MLVNFLVDLGLAMVCGAIIGSEREMRHKPAGISTQTLVMGAAAIFAFLAKNSGTNSMAIAAQIVSGVGFLGAGVILKSEKNETVTNLTTAASLWYSAAVGMALGFDYHAMAFIATIYAVIVSRIPRIHRKEED